MKRAIGYLRVSTEQQQTEGVSLAAQEERIRAYAVASGFELVAILRDEAVSGSIPLALRPAGGELVRMLAKGSAAVVIGWNLDRMFRSTIDALEQTAAWDRKRIALHLIDEGGRAVDCSSSDGRFLLTLKAALAERERKRVGERTRFALAHLKANGFAYAPTPFGFDREGDRLVENPQEQATLARIRSLRASGESLRSIAAELNAACCSPKRGGIWYASTVAKVIARSLTLTQERVAA